MAVTQLVTFAPVGESGEQRHLEACVDEGAWMTSSDRRWCCSSVRAVAALSSGSWTTTK
jgi:hypothetical protein